MQSKAATPGLGIVKGLLMILFGLVSGLWLFGFTLGSYLDYTGNESLLVGLAWFALATGVCSWRGALAITRRNKRKVSPVTVGVWTLLIIAALAWLLFML